MAHLQAILQMLDEEIETMRTQKSAITQLLEAADRPDDPQALQGQITAILCEYLLSNSATAAVAWANSLGWLYPMGKLVDGQRRAIRYSPKHLYGWIEVPPEGVPTALIALVRRRYSGNQGFVHKAW